MQSTSFIAVLIETYEAAYAALKANLISAELKPVVLNVAILAADQVAANNWHGVADRAGAVAGALLRALYPETAAAEAEGLHAFVRLHVGDNQDPEPVPATQQSAPQF